MTNHTMPTENEPHATPVPVSEAAAIASRRLGRTITASSIAWITRNGEISRFQMQGGRVGVLVEEVVAYFREYDRSFRERYRAKGGDSVNWELAFDAVREKERTKHVHRLHPYKGKFIPQLVGAFLDTSETPFLGERWFKQGDVVIDPFCGSGTTLVEANEQGLHAVGVDVSVYNVLIGNAKLAEYNLPAVTQAIARITRRLEVFAQDRPAQAFQSALKGWLNDINARYFSPELRAQYKGNPKALSQYGASVLLRILPEFHALRRQYGIADPDGGQDYMRWYLPSVKEELLFLKQEVLGEQDDDVRRLLMVITGRVARSVRATTHFDLGTLKEPVYEPYYCFKHRKICAPLFTAVAWWRRHAHDTIRRLAAFSQLRTDTRQLCVAGDARKIDLVAALQAAGLPDLAHRLAHREVSGIFTSPPYVGMIDYHGQHAYAYHLFGLPQRSEAEIGRLSLGQSKRAQEAYVEGIAAVLTNMRRYLAPDAHVFIVANDKFGLYPRIASQSGFEIVQTYHRPVPNRTERHRMLPYTENIFHLRLRN